MVRREEREGGRGDKRKHGGTRRTSRKAATRSIPPSRYEGAKTDDFVLVRVPSARWPFGDGSEDAVKVADSTPPIVPLLIVFEDDLRVVVDKPKVGHSL